MKYLLGLLVLLGGSALADVTATPGTWDLYRGSSIAQSGLATEAACIKAADDLNVLRTYTCRTRTTVVVTADAPPPVPVDCVVGPWTPGALVPATCPVSGAQTRTDTRSVLTQPANGGAACPSLTQTVSVTCTPPVVTPPPTAGDFDTRSKAAGVVQALSLKDGVRPPNCGGGWASQGKSCYEPGDAGDKLTVGPDGWKLTTTSTPSANTTGDIRIGWPRGFGAGQRWTYSYAVVINGFADANGKTPDLSGDGWKVALFAGINGPLCGSTELSTTNFYYTGATRLYTRCSTTANDNFEFPQGGAQQQTDTNPKLCMYGANDAAGCVHFRAGLMYFYYDVTPPKIVKAYACWPGSGGWKQFVSTTSYDLGSNPPYGMTNFTNYSTNKKKALPTTPYSMTYSEAILSTQDQALPASCL